MQHDDARRATINGMKLYNIDVDAAITGIRHRFCGTARSMRAAAAERGALK